MIFVVANGTETLAVEQNDGSYRLYGYKWFSSATDSDIAFTLARVVDRHSDLLLLNAKWAIFQLYHGENKLHFDEMMMIFALY
jgi:alkylation response protein AidB-like acyl-CoA dehydrogenase